MTIPIRPKGTDYDEAIRLLMAEGATDDEIVTLISELKQRNEQQKPQSVPLFGAPVLPDAKGQPMGNIAGEALGNISNIGKAFASGVGASLKRTAGLAASSTSGLPIAGALFAATSKDATKLRQAEPAKIDESNKTASVEKIAQFAGQMVGSAPVYGSISAGVRAGASALAPRVADPALKAFLTRSVPGSFWKSAAMSAPANVIEGIAGDAALYPEQVRTPEGILRSAAMSLTGTIFDGFAGSKVIGEALQEATTPQQVKKVVEVLEEVKLQNPQGPSSPLPEGPYSRWIPNAASISARRVDDIIDGPVPTALEIAMNRNTKLFKELADEKLLTIARENTKQQAERTGLAAAEGKTGIFTSDGKLKSLVSVEPSVDDRIQAASMQGAIDRAAESLKTLAVIRRNSGRAIDNLSLIEADVSGSLLTFEELTNLRGLIQTEIRKGGKMSPQQKFLVEVQETLDAASKKGFENMNIKEILDLEDNLLAMSRRLDERGFDAPPKKFIGDVKDVTPQAQRGSVSIKNDTPEVPKPIRFETEPEVGPRTDYASEQLKQDKEFVKTFDTRPKRKGKKDVPDVSITPVITQREAIEQAPQNVAEILEAANIQYEKPKPVGPQPTIRQLVQDRNIPIRDLDNQAYDMLNNLGAARRAADNAVARDGGLLLPKLDDDGVWRGQTTRVEAMPLLEIQRVAGKRIYEVEAFLKAQRTLADPDVDTGMSVQAARAAIAMWQDDPFIQQLATEYRKNTDFMVDYMIALKRLSPQQGEKFKKMMYAPLGRIFNKPKSSNFLSFRKGSARKSAPIFEQTVEMMYATLERTQRNYAWNQLVEQLKKDPLKMQDHMSLAGSVNPALFEDQIKELVQNGVPEKDAADWIKTMYSGTYDKSDGSLIVFNNGIASKYHISDALATAIEANSPLELNLLQKIMMQVSTPMRESVALGLDLSLLGPASDAVSARVQDPGFRILIDPIVGAWNAALRTDTYKEAVAAGLGFGGRLRPDDNVIRPDKGFTSRVRVVRSPITALNDLIRPLSEASRVGLYLSQLRQGATPQAAATFSNNALGNWNVIGAKMRSWSLMTEFFNVGIQSGVLVPKTAKRMLKDPKLAANVGIVGFGAITAPTLGLLAAYADDDELNAMRKADNYDYWYWRDEAGEPQRMRKPGWWLVPIFGSSVEAAWDGMDDASRKRLAKSFLNSVMFNPAPVAAQTALGLLNNDTSPLNPASNIPIVPGGQQDVDPKIQGALQNSQLSMGVRDAVGISPFKTDFLLRQTLGSDIFSLLAIATGGTVGSKDRLPVLGRYSVSPRTPTEGSVMFYEDLKQARRVDKTMREYALKGDEAGLNKYREENKQWVGLYQQIVNPSQQLAQFNVLLRQIAADPKISKETKRKYEEHYRQQMNTFFREYADIRKEMLKQ